MIRSQAFGSDNGVAATICKAQLQV